MRGVLVGNRTKKQHYIAQCLLRIFVGGNDIYECITTTNRTYKTSFENSMCQKDSYESSFLVDNHLENFFADYIDGDQNSFVKISKLFKVRINEID